MIVKCQCLGLILLFTLCSLRAFSQNGHYWTEQYGTRSMLLSGSVIGGVQDLGAVYYNPARLAQINNPAFLLSANVYEWETIKVEDAFGTTGNINKSNFGGVPSLVAGTFKLKFLKNSQFAYAALARQRSNMDFGYEDAIYGEVIEIFPGKEYFGTDVNLINNSKDQWYGFSWSHILTKNLSVGLTSFISIYDMHKGSDIQFRVLTSENNVSTYQNNRTYSFDKYSLLWKAGASYKAGNAILGMTVTTPFINVYGEGNYNYQEFYAGIPGQSEYADMYTDSNQSHLNVKYKTPLSIGLGSTFSVGKYRLNISTEWFSKISEYTIMNAQPFVSQSSGDTLNFQLIDKINAVVNAGIGAEMDFNDKISGYVSFSTDFSAVSPTTPFLDGGEVLNNSSISANYFNFALGIVLDLKGADLTLGASHTGASQDFRAPFVFPENSNENILDSDENGNIKWSRWQFVLSFSVPFLKDFAEKTESNFTDKMKKRKATKP